MVGTGVAVGGRGVAVGGAGVSVSAGVGVGTGVSVGGGVDVAVGGAGVLVDGRVGVLVGRIGVLVGGSGVDVGAGVLVGSGIGVSVGGAGVAVGSVANASAVWRMSGLSSGSGSSMGAVKREQRQVRVMSRLTRMISLRTLDCSLNHFMVGFLPSGDVVIIAWRREMSIVAEALRNDYNTAMVNLPNSANCAIILSSVGSDFEYALRAC